MPRPPARWLLPALPLAFLALLLVAPVVRLLAEGLGAGEWSGGEPLRWLDVWQDDYLRWRVLWSLAQAAITCALALVLGLPVAWVLARVEFAGRRWVLRVLMLPFVVPTLVAAMGVLAGAPAFDGERLPVGPQALCRIVRELGEDFALGLETQLALYRVFDRQLLERLGELLAAAQVGDDEGVGARPRQGKALARFGAQQVLH